MSIQAGSGAASAGTTRWEPLLERLRYCGQRRHLRRTATIALVVGIVLTAINQLDVIVAGNATTVTFVKCGLNFVVPFVVSNLGLLRGRRQVS